MVASWAIASRRSLGVMPPWSTTRWRTDDRRRVARCSRWSFRSVSRIGDRPSSSAWTTSSRISRFRRSSPASARVQCLDALSGVERAGEGRVAHDQSVLEGTACRLALGVDSEPDGAELHLEDRVKPVPPSRRRRQAGQVAAFTSERTRSNDTAGTWWHSSTITWP